MHEEITGPVRYSSGEVRFAALSFSLAACAMVACERIPEYPIPDQRTAPLVQAPVAARVINMDDPGAMAHVVRDISPTLSGSWRWSLEKPALKVRIRFHQRLKYVIDFTLPEITFKDTGPVTIAFTVNDHVLDRLRYTAPGDHHFEKDVPPEWTQVGEDAIVGAEIDKIWVSPTDGARFGIILVRMGLTK